MSDSVFVRAGSSAAFVGSVGTLVMEESLEQEERPVFTETMEGSGSEPENREATITVGEYQQELSELLANAPDHVERMVVSSSCPPIQVAKSVGIMRVG